MEMEGVEQTAGPQVFPTRQEQTVDEPRPVVSDLQPPASPATASAPASSSSASAPPAAPPAASAATAGAAAGPQHQHQHQGVNGIAYAGHQQPASPGTRSDTPLSHPSTPTVVNGRLASLPPPHSQNADPGFNASNGANAAVNAAASALNAARAAAKEQLRWRDPMTVKYDGGGQAQPGKLQAQQTPATALQSPQGQLPPPSAPTPTPTPPTQPQHQLPPHQYSSQQHGHQHSDPLPPLPQLHPQPQPQPQPNLHPHSHSAQHPHPHPHSHQHSHPQHHQQLPLHQQQNPPQPQPPPRHPPPPPYSSQPGPPATLPSLYHPLPPVSSHQPALPPVVRTLASHAPPPLSKPIIMDPPGRRASQVAAPSSPRISGFASPTQDYARVNPKFVDDCTRMTFAVQQSLPESVRRIVRDNWEKCLLGSEFHQAFILNASIHHALPSITRRAVSDFGRKMVAESKEELIGHFATADLDAVAELIIAKASDNFLDKCLEKRLLTIEAKPLINALAKAERLGYDPSDMVQEDQRERVIPQEAYPGATSSAGSNFAQQRPSQPPPAYSPSNTQMQCMRCFRTFTYPSSFEYHTKHSVCSAVPPTSEGFKHACAPCGQGFTRAEDLQAHQDNRVCGNLAIKPSRGPGRPPRAAPVTQANPVAILPSMSTHGSGTNGYPPSQSQVQQTPSQPQAIPRRTATAVPSATATPTGSPNPADPYGHLSRAELEAMQEELQAAEAKYAPRFKEAELIRDENDRRVKIEGLRNSFGTKQSMIRKKYGVRLRERRTKAEIQAEKERLGIKRAEREKAKAAMGGAPPNSSSPAVNADAGGTRPSGASGWTAANTPRTNNVWEEHDAKRRRVDGSGAYQTPYKSVAEETPTRKPLSVSEMGSGLSGSPATAATHDPTVLSLSQPARVQTHEPAQPSPATADPIPDRPSPTSTSTPNGDIQRESTGLMLSEQRQHPLKIDDDSGSSSDEEDIPSTLPSHLRPNMTPQQSHMVSGASGAAVTS